MSYDFCVQSHSQEEKWLWVPGDPKPGSRFLPNQWPHFPWSLGNIVWIRALRSCAFLPANLQITCQPWTIIDIVIPFKYENCHNKRKHNFLNIYSNLYIDQYGHYLNLIWWNSIIPKLNSATILPKPGGSCPRYRVHTCAPVIVKIELSVIPALNCSGLATARWIWLLVQLPVTQSSEAPRWGARTHWDYDTVSIGSSLEEEAVCLLITYRHMTLGWS